MATPFGDGSLFPHMKKVVHIITKSNWGGAQRYVYDLATGLPNDKFESVVIAGGNGTLVEKLTETGVRTITLESLGRDINPLKDFSSLVDLIKMLRKERPDILHLNSSKIGALGALAGRLTGTKKIIFTAHGWAFNEDRSFASKMFIKLTHWLTILLCHRVIAVSQNIADQVLWWPRAKGKIVVILNSIKKEPLYTAKGAIQVLASMNENLKQSLAKDPTLKKTLWIGTVAELHRIKGHVYALEAIKQITARTGKRKQESRIIFTIIGEGQERQNLEQKIKELGLEEQVFLMGHVPNANLYLKAFDIFLFPSLSEGLGYALVEAGAAGLPCISTAVGGLPEVVEDMKSGILIQPRKSQDIAHSIEFLMEHPKIALEHGKALKERVEEKFNFETMLNKVIDLYEKPLIEDPQTHSQ